MNRRTFLTRLTGGAAALALAGCGRSGDGAPAYLRGYEELYRADPRGAALAWFREARFGLFMHYGLYSIPGRGEWVQLREAIPVAAYAALAEQFRPDRFDADFITDLALEAGMKYVNLTARHHDSFSLFATEASDYDSVDAAGRDLVGELAEACREKGLGCFFYYSYACDWHHPYFYPREAGWENARPDYDEPQPEYLYEKPEDFERYIDFCHAQLRELLTHYGPVSGIWLDPIMGYYRNPDVFPIERTYGLIRSLQPQTLISFKQGATGDEDFVAPERNPRAHPNGGAVGDRAWAANEEKPIEICDTLQPRTWGYNRAMDGRHRTADDVMRMLEHADDVGANLLLNTGPLPDGSIHPDDVATLREVGRRLRSRS